MKSKDNPIEEFDVVALLRDREDLGLVTGQVGTVVEVLDKTAVEIEFVTLEGETFVMVVIPVKDLLVLHYAPVAA